MCPRPPIPMDPNKLEQPKQVRRRTSHLATVVPHSHQPAFVEGGGGLGPWNLAAAFFFRLFHED